MREAVVLSENLARTNFAPRFPILDKDGNVRAANYKEFGELPSEVQMAERRKAKR